MKQYIYPRVLKPSNPHFNSYLRDIKSKVIVYFSNDINKRAEFEELFY